MKLNTKLVGILNYTLDPFSYGKKSFTIKAYNKLNIDGVDIINK